MPKLFQISMELNRGSVGRIAEHIGESAIQNGWTSYITYARNSNSSSSEKIKIGSKYDIYMHGIETRIFDNHSFSSKSATKELVNNIKKINPDLIHMHYLHGYYINIEILFDFFKESKIPLVWTFHDCWSFTGHCAHFDFVGCEKWKTQCFNCEQKYEYPKSLIFDRSRLNYIEKKRIFTSVENMTIVPVSKWLETKVKDSFFRDYPCLVINNGIDLDVFYPRLSKGPFCKSYGLDGKFVILGVATNWNRNKGFYEFIKLANLIDSNKYSIVLIGLPENIIKKLPPNIIGIKRTESVNQLADLYSAADVFLNLTFEDSYPTTNLESLACGTPVITYKTGGSVESLCINTGLLVDKGFLFDVLIAIEEVYSKGKDFYSSNCRQRAIENFDKKNKFNSYVKLYNNLINK